MSHITSFIIRRKDVLSNFHLLIESLLINCCFNYAKNISKRMIVVRNYPIPILTMVKKSKNRYWPTQSAGEVSMGRQKFFIRCAFSPFVFAV